LWIESGDYSSFCVVACQHKVQLMPTTKFMTFYGTSSKPAGSKYFDSTPAAGCSNYRKCCGVCVLSPTSLNLACRPRPSDHRPHEAHRALSDSGRSGNGYFCDTSGSYREADVARKRGCAPA
jgi:hypothetical protein